MHFETMILLLFSVLGLIDGALFALLFRRRRFYFYALAMALLGVQQARISSGMQRGMTGSDSGHSIWRMG